MGKFSRWCQESHARGVERRRVQAIGAVQPRPKEPKPLVSDQERLLRIAGGVVVGIAVAHVVNSGNNGANGWALAAWANQNGVQL